MILPRALAISAGGERGSRRRDVDDRLDALIVEHVAGDVGRQIGFVEMIGGDDLDLAAEHLAAEILRSHLRRGLAAGAGDVGVQPGHVEDGAELQRRLVLGLEAVRRRPTGPPTRTSAAFIFAKFPPATLAGLVLRAAFVVCRSIMAQQFERSKQARAVVRAMMRLRFPQGGTVANAAITSLRSERSEAIRSIASRLFLSALPTNRRWTRDERSDCIGRSKRGVMSSRRTLLLLALLIIGTANARRSRLPAAAAGRGPGRRDRRCA